MVYHEVTCVLYNGIVTLEFFGTASIVDLATKLLSWLLKSRSWNPLGLTDIFSFFYSCRESRVNELRKADVWVFLLGESAGRRNGTCLRQLVF